MNWRFWRRGKPKGFERTCYCGDVYVDTKAPEEIFANEFAMCLLMPEKEVKRSFREVKRSRKIHTPTGITFALAVIYGVAPEIMLGRLTDLGLLLKGELE